MSYSFYIRAESKDEARRLVGLEFDRIIASMPQFTSERERAESTVDVYLDVLADDDTRDVCVHMSGYVSRNGSDDDGPLLASGISLGVSLMTRLGA